MLISRLTKRIPLYNKSFNNNTLSGGVLDEKKRRLFKGGRVVS